MARQNGRTTVHFDPGDGFPVCGQIGSVLMTTDPDDEDDEGDDFTLCGKCMRNPRWQLAYREAKAATRR